MHEALSLSNALARRKGRSICRHRLLLVVDPVSVSPLLDKAYKGINLVSKMTCLDLEQLRWPMLDGWAIIGLSSGKDDGITH